VAPRRESVQGRRPIDLIDEAALSPNDIAVDEAVPGHDLAGPAQDRLPVHGRVPDERVELAVFPARVDAGRQIGQEPGVEVPAGER